MISKTVFSRCSVENVIDLSMTLLQKTRFLRTSSQKAYDLKAISYFFIAALATRIAINYPRIFHETFLFLDYQQHNQIKDLLLSAKHF